MGHNHAHSQTIPAVDERYREIRKVTLIGSVVDLLLGLAKIWGGFLAHSQALIADGIHSLSDLATDAIVIYAAKKSTKEADDEHPYGHGRIETLATVALGMALVGVALGISIDAINRLFHPEKLWVPGAAALIIAAISIVAKEMIYHYSMRIARRYNSNLLRANAWHSRTDSISSVIVVIGVAGSMAGLNYLDALAAIGVAIMIIKIGWDFSWHSVQELIDTGLEPERVEKIREAILDVDGVLSLHILRTRRMGSDALVDVHIQVAPYLSVSEGHYISEIVRQKIIHDIEEVADVMVHIDPEDDEMSDMDMALPIRNKLMHELKKCLSDVPDINQLSDKDITLHYLQGKIQVDLVLPLGLLENEPLAVKGRLAKRLESFVADWDEVDEVALYFH